MAIISETRGVYDFDEVDLQFYGDIFLTQGDQESLVIEAEESILPKIETEVHNGRLVIKPARLLDRLIPHTGPVHYRISMKKIHGLSIAGAGTLAAPQISTDQLKLDVSGSADMKIDHLESPSLHLTVSGSAQVDLGGGQVERQVIQISGSGHLSAGKVESQEADLRISGTGQVQIYVHQAMDVSISGYGKVEYGGEPKINSRISGIGQIEKLKPTQNRL